MNVPWVWTTAAVIPSVLTPLVVFSAHVMLDILGMVRLALVGIKTRMNKINIR